jgi:hypothetical protein
MQKGSLVICVAPTHKKDMCWMKDLTDEEVSGPKFGEICEVEVVFKNCITLVEYPLSEEFFPMKWFKEIQPPMDLTKLLEGSEQMRYRLVGINNEQKCIDLLSKS